MFSPATIIVLRIHLLQKQNSCLPKVVMDSYYRFSHPEYVSGPVDVRYKNKKRK